MDDNNQFNFFFVALLVLAVIIVAGAILRCWFYRYQLMEDGIQIRQGVFFKRHLNLKFKRVQNVNINHPFYFRPLGLVTLKIDGAGSKREEVHIAALDLDAARAIRQTIQLKKGQVGLSDNTSDSLPGNEASPGGDGSHGEGEKFYTRSFADLVIHGLTNNRAWIVVGGIAGFLLSTPFSVSDAIELLQGYVGSVISNESITYTVMLFTLSFVLAVALTALLSVLGSIVTYYGFTLYRSDKSLMVHRGLINKQEINMQKSRVQSIYFRQDWLDLYLRRVNVIFEQITHTEHDFEGGENSKKILVPSARVWERSELAQEIFELPDIATLEFQPISKRHFYKHAIIWSILYLFIATVADMTDGFNPVIIAAIWVPHVFLMYMHWLRAGLVLVGDYVVVRRGIIGIDYIVFPAYKLQAVDHVQSLLMKRRKLTNIVFHTASRTARVAYLPTQFVKEILDYCVYSVEANSRSWM
ncbi:MAG: PH domain-containing protein [Gammaproteobacteria bacterium]|jgi:putative membrane protein|nr:PH domain-containing protein [Gammaproteobacteria bacterium]MDP6731879.1 PH domain-containing protein [Gammaproteobacteria bacterium]|tara:strand:- start:1065 stop:2474 length:1410 start_codon:yes stop_codon:yes gene_type:complete